MIENFNGFFYFIIFILAIGLQGVYVFRIVFSPSGLIKEYNTGENSLYLARVLGVFIIPLFLMGNIILFRGTDGTWVYFILSFMIGLCQLIYETAFYFKLVDKNISAKNSKLDIGVSVFFVIASVILIYGLSDKIY